LKLRRPPTVAAIDDHFAALQGQLPISVQCKLPLFLLVVGFSL
jgi:hypothetical protein